jgi:hypothetical protein
MADGSPGSIIGTWDLTALDVTDGSGSAELEFGQEILNSLSASGCYLVTLTFNEDLTLLTQDATNYLEISVNSLGTGLDVPCPGQRDTNETTYTYSDGVLSFTDGNLESVTVEVSINGDVMTIPAQDLGVENFNSGGDLRFTRR